MPKKEKEKEKEQELQEEQQSQEHTDIENDQSTLTREIEDKDELEKAIKAVRSEIGQEQKDQGLAAASKQIIQGKDKKLTKAAKLEVTEKRLLKSKKRTFREKLDAMVKKMTSKKFSSIKFTPIASIKKYLNKRNNRQK